MGYFCQALILWRLLFFRFELLADSVSEAFSEKFCIGSTRRLLSIVSLFSSFGVALLFFFFCLIVFWILSLSSWEITPVSASSTWFIALLSSMLVSWTLLISSRLSDWISSNGVYINNTLDITFCSSSILRFAFWLFK